MATTDIHIRVDKEVKEETESILKEIGLSISDLVNMTFRRTIRKKGIPFSTNLYDRIPGDMHIETREQLLNYVNQSIDEDTGIRYSIEDVESRLREQEANYKQQRKAQRAVLKELQAA